MLDKNFFLNIIRSFSLMILIPFLYLMERTSLLTPMMVITLAFFILASVLTKGVSLIIYKKKDFVSNYQHINKYVSTGLNIVSGIFIIAISLYTAFIAKQVKNPAFVIVGFVVALLIIVSSYTRFKVKEDQFIRPSYYLFVNILYVFYALFLIIFTIISYRHNLEFPTRFLISFGIGVLFVAVIKLSRIIFNLEVNE